VPDLKPEACPLCANRQFERVFVYHEPPQGEVRFRFSAGVYQREVYRCTVCGHFLSVHTMQAPEFYEDEYVDSTYGSDDGIRSAFERIIALDPSNSDNRGRVQRILEFTAMHLKAPAAGKRLPAVLDVGSGLCVFLYEMKAAGWDCTALDPDLRAVQHARQVVGVHAIDADFMLAEDIGRFDLVAFNKVLEHVQDPVAMLAKSQENLQDGGMVYVEVPDGECAAVDGPAREEFFIEHNHVFSMASLALLAQRTGFLPLLIERLREPSTKYTLRAFLAPVEKDRDSADRTLSR